MAHEGYHQLFDITLAIMNIIICLLSILFLYLLIRLYKSHKQEFENKEYELLQDNVSFGYESSLSTPTHSGIKETKNVLYFVMFGIICICIASLCGAIFYSETYLTYQSTFITAAFESMHELFWNLGEIACYCLFVDRLKHSFKHTSHKISSIQFLIFWIAIIIYLLCVIAFCMVEFDSVSSIFNTHDIISWIYVFGIELIDFLIAFWLIFLFCKKLLHVTIDINQSSTFFMDNLNKKSVMLLNLITKYCVLCITAISSTQIVNIIQIIIFIIIDDANSNPNFHELIFLSLHRALMTLDMVINVMCLFLTISYTAKYYNTLCSSAQNSIQNCCNKWASSSTIKRRQNAAFELALLDESGNW
eukprot:541353_1